MMLLFTIIMHWEYLGGLHNILQNIMHSEYAIERTFFFALIIMTSCNTVITLPETMTSKGCSGIKEKLPLPKEEKT